MSQGTHHKTIKKALAEAANAGTIAAATAGILQQIANQLAPVIGARGVDVLINRARHLASAAFPWLATVEETATHATTLNDIKARLAAQPLPMATDASYALLASFIKLLEGLIGESLTERLLSPVWAPASSTPEQESKS